MQAFRVDIRIRLVSGGPIKSSSAASLSVIHPLKDLEHIPKPAHLDFMIPVVKVLKVVIHD